MDGELRFRVRSNSTDEVYEIVAKRSGSRQSIVCTCLAGQNGLVCSHRTDLMNGVVGRLVEEQAHDVEALATMFAGTPLATRLADLAELENEAAVIKKQIASQKKRVARLMFGN